VSKCQTCKRSRNPAANSKERLTFFRQQLFASSGVVVVSVKESNQRLPRAITSVIYTCKQAKFHVQLGFLLLVSLPSSSAIESLLSIGQFGQTLKQRLLRHLLRLQNKKRSPYARNKKKNNFHWIRSDKHRKILPEARLKKYF